MALVQRSFDDLGTPLVDVTFAVIDIETTGGTPGALGITEVGAAKFRGGECLGTFQTLVNPGLAIPPMITMLTGITEAMVLPAPPIEQVLPALLAFVGDAVIVGHNVRYDLSFLNAALDAHGYPRFANARLDTLGLARRLVRDELPNLRLSTLARHFRTVTDPIHRALDDALATSEVLHALIERATAFGVLALDDLLALPTVRAHPSVAKLVLTATLPRTPGVYLFRDARGDVLYVGKATNLRARVRSYFSGDDRRKVPQLLRETAAIDHIVCSSPLEAAVLEVRLIQHHLPRFNRRSKTWRSYAYLKLTLAERFPRLAVVREARDDGALYLGPVPSASAANLVREAIESAVPLRRCSRRVARAPIEPMAPCAPAQLGVAACPCSGHTGDDDYASIVDDACRGLTTDPTLLLDRLAGRMHALARDQRFEEAANVRDRLRALAGALRRSRLLSALGAAGRVVVDAREGMLEIIDGRLRTDDDAHTPQLFVAPRRAPVARASVDELLTVARWLEREAAGGRVRLVEVDGTFATPLPHIPSFEPVPEQAARPPPD